MNINCKIKDNHVTIHRAREARSQKGSRGTLGSPCTGEIEEILRVYYSGYGHEGSVSKMS